MSDTDDLGYTVSTTSAEALEAYDQGVPVGLMAPAVARIHDMGGGSREQKDIFQEELTPWAPCAISFSSCVTSCALII